MSSVLREMYEESRRGEIDGRKRGDTEIDCSVRKRERERVSERKREREQSQLLYLLSLEEERPEGSSLQGETKLKHSTQKSMRRLHGVTTNQTLIDCQYI